MIKISDFIIENLENKISPELDEIFKEVVIDADNLNH
jgi:hypothetical protein